PAFLAGVLTLGIGVWIGWGNEIATALDRRRAPDAGKTHERQKTPSAWAEPLRGPAAVMCGAGFASLLALALGKFAPAFLVPLRVVLIVGALVAAGMVVWWRLCDLGEQTFEARAWTAGFVVVGAALIFCAREAMDESWDSLRMALGVFSVVAAV